MLTGFNHLLLIHKSCLEGFSFQQMSPHSACLYFCLKVCVTTQLAVFFCSSHQPPIPPSDSIHPKAFQWVQPCGKQGNHVKWTLDSTKDCRQAPSQWPSSSKQFAKCILFPHEEVELLFFNCGRDAFKNCRGNLKKIDLHGNCTGLKRYTYLLRINVHAHFATQSKAKEEEMIRCSFPSSAICIANVAARCSRAAESQPFP